MHALVAICAIANRNFHFNPYHVLSLFNLNNTKLCTDYFKLCFVKKGYLNFFSKNFKC